MKLSYPRLVVAGTKGDSGKTMVSLGLLLALRKQGLTPGAFKKGPDFIDAAWLGWAGGCTGRNLDTYMMGEDRVRRSFLVHARPDQINLVEGNRGIHDGSDAQGTHSTAELAKLLQAPTVLVLPITKTTRTAAALVLGCRQLDPELNIAGVILNQYAGPRHERVVRQAIEQYAGVPVVGAIPKLGFDLIPNRHLGLVTLFEFEGQDQVETELLNMAKSCLNLDQIMAIARQVQPPTFSIESHEEDREDGRGLRIGVIHDQAFSFYYAENIEALERSGAGVVPISALDSPSLPENLDAMYIGGGFPELHLEKLCANRGLMDELRREAEEGLPVYAECGGLMYLAKSVEYGTVTYPLTGLIPVELNVSEKPQGHGYCEVRVDKPNPFFAEGTLLKGHEFHYSKIVSGGGDSQTAFAVKRGTGCFDKRDALIYKNVLAGFLHLHAAGAPEWVAGMLRAARRHHDRKGRNLPIESDALHANPDGRRVTERQ